MLKFNTIKKSQNLGGKSEEKKNHSRFCFFTDKRQKYPVGISKPLYTNE